MDTESHATEKQNLYEDASGRVVEFKMKVFLQNMELTLGNITNGIYIRRGRSYGHKMVLRVCEKNSDIIGLQDER